MRIPASPPSAPAAGPLRLLRRALGMALLFAALGLSHCQALGQLFR